MCCSLVKGSKLITDDSFFLLLLFFHFYQWECQYWKSFKKTNVYCTHSAHVTQFLLQFLVLGFAKQICVSWLLTTFLVEHWEGEGKSALKIIGSADLHDYD